MKEVENLKRIMDKAIFNNHNKVTFVVHELEESLDMYIRTLVTDYDVKILAIKPIYLDSVTRITIEIKEIKEDFITKQRREEENAKIRI